MKHLVLGGSEGMGYAYALIRAAQKHTLTIVARRPAVLDAARENLLKSGAPHVETISGDLLDTSFRTALLRRESGFASVLISGPSPLAGGLDVLEQAQDALISQGFAACVTYPADVLQWARGKGLNPGGRVYVIGSSASTEPLLNSRFFLSAALRRVLEEMVNEMGPGFRSMDKEIHVWKPKVVLTPLSAAFAERLAGKNLTEVEQQGCLRSFFSVERVPRAGEFISERLADIGSQAHDGAGQ